MSGEAEDSAVETLARILHDIALGCEPHEPYRTGIDQQTVHRIQAGWLIKAIRREMASNTLRLSDTGDTPDGAS